MATTADPPRSGRQRRDDTLAKLRENGADVWVATASPDGLAHLIPLSYAWIGERIVLAAPPGSLTVRNAQASGGVRLGFGPTRDVVMIDGELERTLAVGEESAWEIADGYAGQADWDPREEPDQYVFMVLRPRRILAWRESNELAGKLLMRDGEWLY